MVNQFQGFGGVPYNNYGLGTYNQNIAMSPAAILDPSLPKGDCLQKVNDQNSALSYRMNPNSRAVLFDANADIFYIVTSDASGSNSVQAFSFTPYEPAKVESEKYVTKEEFDKFKEDILSGKQFVREPKYRNAKSGKPADRSESD